MIDPVGVDDDHALACLPKDLGQFRAIDVLAGDDVPEHVPGSDRWQLVVVADDDEPRSRSDRADQPVHKKQIDHRCFVDDDRVIFQRVLRVSPEIRAAFLIEGVFQQPVDRRCGMSAGLRDSLGRPAGRRRDGSLQTAVFQYVDDRIDDRGLAGARAAGDDGHAHVQARCHRVFLLFAETDPRCYLRLPDQAVDRSADRFQVGVVQVAQAFADILFGRVKRYQIDDALLFHQIDVHVAEESHDLDIAPHQIPRQIEQFSRLLAKFFFREEGVSFVGEPLQREFDPALDAVFIVFLDPDLLGDLVGLPEADPVNVIDQRVRILQNDIDGVCAVNLIEFQCLLGADPVLLERHGHLGEFPVFRKGCGDLFCRLRSDTGYFDESFRLLFDDVERVFTKGRNNGCRRFSADAL